VQNLFFSQKISSFSLSFLLGAALAILAGCGAGTPDAPASTVPSLTITLTNSGVPVTSITNGTPATVKATLKDATGAAVIGAVVTFSTDPTLAAITPAATALTDSTGVATVTLSPATVTATGATTITATSQVGTTALTGTIGYSVDAPARIAPSLAITLTNGGVPVTSITSGTPATVKATLKGATGAAVAGAVVTFSTDTTLATITPAATALTDSSGVATVTLSPATVSATGATTITATSQVGTTALTGTIGYSVGGALVNITSPVFGVSTLSAFGTTSVAVTVSSGGIAVTTPQTVTFSSACASSGKAVLSASVVTVNGIATGSYRDNGCAGTDTVTASVSGIASSSASLTITAPTAGSIQYVSAIPTNISLKGSGGTSASQVTFKVLDSSGNPLSGKTVTFGLSTTIGGLSLTSSTGISDSAGLVVAIVNSGTVSTPVRVTASTPGATAGSTLTTQSSQLSITTGIPDQAGFSVSATKLNFEGLTTDGVTTILTARLADHFKNPAPDGTTVNFTAEAGSVTGTCNTVAGACSATYTTQGTRPLDGRVTVLAYAVGEETFTDLNGNGLADLAPVNEMIDANGVSTDLPEAWVDYNENGLRDANEPFLDFNNDGLYTPADGKFAGVLCDNTIAPPAGSSAGTCAITPAGLPIKSLHVRSQVVIALSDTKAIITTTPASINLGGLCGTAAQSVGIRIVDVNGNPMPAGTTIAVATTNGTLVAPTSFIEPNSSAKPIGSNYSVSIQSDSSIVITCTDATPNGVLTITVTTPSGVVTTKQVAVAN
jgi:hypothetical protein